MAREHTEQLNGMVLSAALARTLCSIAEAGIADRLAPDATRSVAELAAECGVHERTLYRVLRFLAAHGIFAERAPGKFEHTPLSRALREDAPGSYRASARMFHHIFPAWNGLHHTLLTGEPGFAVVMGEPLFEHLGKRPDVAAIFDSGMTAVHGYETAAMLDAYTFAGIDTLADVGGGNGGLISAVLEAYPAMRGILFDLGHVIDRARANLDRVGLASRCTAMAGSFFEEFPAGADAYLMRHIIHDWDDDQCKQILDNCRAVIPDRGRLLLVECVVPEDNAPSITKYFDMCMLAFPGGIERTEREFGDMFRRSGFELASVTPTTTMVSVLEARPV